MKVLTDLTLIVHRTDEIAELIRKIELVAADNTTLPPFQAGAHIMVALPGGAENAYSLIDPGGDPTAPDSYVLGVRLDGAGGGGSRYMHGLRPGARVTATGPKNHFPLADGDAPVLLLAGGIGVTPLISMAAALARQGRNFRMVYACRSIAAAGFADDLAVAHGDRLALHLDDRAGAPVAVAERIAEAGPDAHVYVCGPKPMIDATRAAMDALGCAPEQFHAELFDNVSHQSGDQPFEVEIASTGQIFTIPPDKTIIEVLESGGVELVHDCQRGDCGICQTDVLEGTPDHRDVVLSAAERASGKVMQICVSRALSARLKLDL